LHHRSLQSEHRKTRFFRWKYFGTCNGDVRRWRINPWYAIPNFHERKHHRRWIFLVQRLRNVFHYQRLPLALLSRWQTPAFCCKKIIGFWIYLYHDIEELSCLYCWSNWEILKTQYFCSSFEALAQRSKRRFFQRIRFNEEYASFLKATALEINSFSKLNSQKVRRTVHELIFQRQRNQPDHYVSGFISCLHR